jgi:FKBP-type peptidyl-prolyl cis-trans isomerase FklB
MTKAFKERLKVSVKWFLPLYLFTFLPLLSCSEEEDAEANEYANWQTRNDAYWKTLEDSLTRGNGQWKKIKSFTKDETAAGEATDYIYVKVLETGTGTESPYFTDTVTTSYALRLMPTTQHPEGFLVQKTYYGNTYDQQTTGTFVTTLNNSSLVVSGFITALLHMHSGDRWRVYIPYGQAYGASSQTNVPAYSTLVYDLALIRFSHPTKEP